MRLYLAGSCTRPEPIKKYIPLYILESFYYIQPWQLDEMKKWKGFILDSGAFTFMSNVKGSRGVDFDDWTSKYIQFINNNDIKDFLELDVDSVVGYQKVRALRERLEKETGKRCIPVWHKSRGIKEWIHLTEEYDYVALGGFAIKEIKRKDYVYIPKLLKIAEENECKVHGLGFTNSISYSMDFYSVDSTNWLSSSRFGDMEYFNGKEMVKVKTPKGKKPVHYKIRDEFIIQEYIKLQKYLDRK